MSMIKTALVLLAPLCHGNVDSATQAAKAREVVEVGSHAHLVRSEKEIREQRERLERAAALQ